MKHLDLFSGIGGFALAADRVWPGIKHTFCEIDPFCQQVLKKHWPNAKIYGDIRTVTADSDIHGLQEQGAEQQAGGARQPYETNQPTGDIRTVTNASGNGLDAEQGESEVDNQEGESVSKKDSVGRRGLQLGATDSVDLLTGGFPCQPFSTAGRRAGTEDNRFLWPEMRRCVAEFRPRWVVAENVRGILSIEGGLVFEQVCTDLEALGYEVQAFVIPAAGVGAPHRRERVWFVAHASGGRPRGRRPESQGGTDKWQVHSAEERETEHDVRGQTAGRSGVVAQNNSDAEHAGLQGYGKRGSAGEGRGKSSVVGSPSDSWAKDWLEVATRLCGMDDGLPVGLDGFELSASGHRRERLKSLGNAIVPQVAEQIFRTIKEYEK